MKHSRIALGLSAAILALTGSASESAIVYNYSFPSTQGSGNISGTFQITLSDFVTDDFRTFSLAQSDFCMLSSGLVCEQIAFYSDGDGSGHDATGIWSSGSGYIGGFNDQALTHYGTYSNINGVTSTLVVSPAPVPEPAAWAMMLVGFGAAGCAMRRKPVPVSVTHAS